MIPSTDAILTLAFYSLASALLVRLLYINWLARAGLGMQELNPLWMVFDSRGKKGTFVSLIIFFMFFGVWIFAGLKANSWAGEMVLCLILGANWYHDERQIGLFRKYPHFSSLLRCPHCKTMNEGTFCSKCHKMISANMIRMMG